MKLFEIETGWMGESYERAYAWAESSERALQLFTDKHGADRDIAQCNIRELFDSKAAEFVTDTDDSGWPS